MKYKQSKVFKTDQLYKMINKELILYDKSKKQFGIKTYKDEATHKALIKMINNIRVPLYHKLEEETKMNLAMYL